MSYYPDSRTPAEKGLPQYTLEAPQGHGSFPSDAQGSPRGNPGGGSHGSLNAGPPQQQDHQHQHHHQQQAFSPAPQHQGSYYSTQHPQQPYIQPGMVQVPGGGNRNALNKPNDASGLREWSNGICGWSNNCGTCAFACCCPCIVYGQNHSRLRHLRGTGTPHPSGGETVNAACCIYLGVLCIAGCACCIQMGNREEIRERYGIRGSGFGDFCTTWCCQPCSLTQESGEIKLEEKSFETLGQQPGRHPQMSIQPQLA